MTPLFPQPHTHHPMHSYTQGHYTKLAPEEWTSLFTAGAGSLVIPLGGGGGGGETVCHSLPHSLIANMSSFSIRYQMSRKYDFGKAAYHSCLDCFLEPAGHNTDSSGRTRCTPDVHQTHQTCIRHAPDMHQTHQTCTRHIRHASDTHQTCTRYIRHASDTHQTCTRHIRHASDTHTYSVACPRWTSG